MSAYKKLVNWAFHSNMNNIINIFLCIALFFSSGCTTKTPSKELKLFNSESFIRNEIVKLKNDKSTLLKSVNYNRQNEIIQVDTVDWSKEFELIVASNLSEKYLSYQTDTIQENDSTIVTYTAKETKAEVRKFVVVNYNNTIKRISILRMKENAFYYSRQEIEYLPQTIFTISAKEKMILSDTTSYRITGVIK